MCNGQHALVVHSGGYLRAMKLIFRDAPEQDRNGSFSFTDHRSMKCAWSHLKEKILLMLVVIVEVDVAAKGPSGKGHCIDAGRWHNHPVIRSFLSTA